MTKYDINIRGNTEINDKVQPTLYKFKQVRRKIDFGNPYIIVFILISFTVLIYGAWVVVEVYNIEILKIDPAYISNQKLSFYINTNIWILGFNITILGILKSKFNIIKNKEYNKLFFEIFIFSFSLFLYTLLILLSSYALSKPDGGFIHEDIPLFKPSYLAYTAVCLFIFGIAGWFMEMLVLLDFLRKISTN